MGKQKGMGSRQSLSERHLHGLQNLLTYHFLLPDPPQGQTMDISIYAVATMANTALPHKYWLTSSGGGWDSLCLACYFLYKETTYEKISDCTIVSMYTLPLLSYQFTYMSLSVQIKISNVRYENRETPGDSEVTNHAVILK